MIKKMFCPNCQTPFTLPGDKSITAWQCTCCNTKLHPATDDTEESDWYTITEEPLEGQDTVVMDSEHSAKANTNTIKTSPPLASSLHGSSKIEKYQLHEEIGHGAMSIIVRATDRNIRRNVAMKVLPKDASEIQQSRFVEESQVTGQLEHPNIVPIHDIGTDKDGRLFFTMKLVKGRSLGEILDDLRKKSPKAIKHHSLLRLLRTLVNVCNAIDFAHSKNVIHRDLKPDNIMVGDFGEVLVMDWGLSRLLKNSLRELKTSKTQRENKTKKHDSEAVSTVRRDTETANSRDTIDGQIIGTPLYMSPEQARGEISTIDQRSDIYGLGAILYEILTLLPPVTGESIKDVIKEVCRGSIIAPEKRAPHKQIPAELSAIAIKCLSYSPYNRYASVRELRDDLNRYIAGYSVSAKEDNHLESFIKLIKRNQATSLVISIATLLLLGSGIFFYFRLSTEKNKAENDRDRAFSALRERNTEEHKRKKAEAKNKILEEKALAESQRSWHLVFADDFSKNNFKSNWLYTGENREIKNGKLRLIGQGERRLLLKSHQIGDLRIEFDCITKGDFLNDVTCFLSAIRSKAGVIPKDYGYIFQYGGNSNTRNALLRYGHKPLWIEKASPLSQNTLYRVRAEKVGKRLSLIVNDEEIFSVVDPDPLIGPERSGVGIYSWGAEIWYDNIKIYKLGSPLKVDMLDLAEEYLRLGHYGTAIDLFTDIVSSTAERSRRRKAITGRRAAIAERKARKLISGYSKTINRKYKPKNAKLEITKAELQLTLNGTAVKELKTFRKMKIQKLKIINTGIRSLGALKGMPIQELFLQGKNIKNVSVITTLPLKKLYLINTSVTDIRPLKGLKLTELVFSVQNVEKGLEIIKNMDSLKLLGNTQTQLLPPKTFWRNFSKSENNKNNNKNILGK